MASPTKIVKGRHVCKVTTLLNSNFPREPSSIGWVLQVFSHSQRLREAMNLFLAGRKNPQLLSRIRATTPNQIVNNESLAQKWSVDDYILVLEKA